MFKTLRLPNCSLQLPNKSPTLQFFTPNPPEIIIEHIFDQFTK
jgi:hypothetical protein